MASGKAVAIGMLLALAAMAVFIQEASAAPAPKTQTATSKCGITGCKKCNKRGNGLCTRCSKGYALNAGGTCDCAAGYGVCTNPAAVTGRKRHASPKVCPAGGLAPKKLYCQKCKKNGGGGGSLVWGPGVAICGGPVVVVNAVNVVITSTAAPVNPVDAAQTIGGCNPAVLTGISDAFIAGATAANGTDATVTPQPITCASDGGNPAGTVYTFTLTWKGGPSAQEVAALLNATPNPQTQCAFGGANWCAVYTTATGGDITSIQATLPTPPSPGPTPSPTPGGAPPPPAFFS